MSSSGCSDPGTLTSAEAFTVRLLVTSSLASRILAPAAATVALALALAGAAPALAQTSTSPGGPSLSNSPPVSLGHGKSPSQKSSTSSAMTRKKNSSSSTARATRLPNTGYDVWAVALLGAGLIAAGVGLRLRVRDVRWP